MKKGLSVLLIAAALFGFYGGATSLNDILASKDYWEEVGEKSTADMNKLEDGLNQLKDNEQAYLDGMEQVKEGEVALADAADQLAAGRAKLAKGEADYAAAPAKLRAGEAALAAGEAEYADGETTLANAKALKKKLDAGVEKLSNPTTGYPAWRAGILQAYADPDAIASLQKNGSLDADLINGFKTELEGKYETLSSAVAAYDGLDTIIATLNALPAAAQAQDIPAPDALKAIAAKLDKSAYVAGNHVPAYWVGVAEQFQTGIIGQVATTAGDSSITTIAQVKALKDQAEQGIALCDQLLQLVAGKKAIQDELLPLLKTAGSNQQVIDALGGEAAVKAILAGLQGDDMTFLATMDKVMKMAPELQKTIARAIAKGENDLKAGAAKLAAGKKQLAQGYADYAAAPGQLADGRKQLADGEAQFAEGEKALEDGKKQLAQYEDGEQQVRDGLATLMATEADPGLESILERRGGDDMFDDANGHLDLNEGLEAVEVGRGYQAESGELITKEITNRAIGTAAGLGAGVLAVLAAILSFLKKNKGAGISAIIAAAAGCFGCFVGMGAGEYYSDIAGSTVGTLPFIAAGVLAAVSIVFAIVHFSAKPEAAAK